MRMPHWCRAGASSSSAVVVVLLVAAAGVTIWRYSSALGAAGPRARGTREQHTRRSGRDGVLTQREAMNEYVISPSQELLDEIDGQRADLRSGRERTRSGQRRRATARRARSRRPTAPSSGHSSPARAHGVTDAAILKRLNQAEARVIGPLTSLDGSTPGEVARGRARGEQRTARPVIAAIVGALVADRGRLAFALFTLRLIVRISSRERELEQTVESLSDRDTLLERLRSTTGGSTRSRTRCSRRERDRQRPTSEQSSAVAEAAATIEELTATARSIADNAESGRPPPSRPATRCATCRSRSRRSPSARSRWASAHRRSARCSS